MVDRVILRLLRRLHSDERGFSLVESLAAITILAVGAFSAAQALSFGLTTSGLSRQRIAARAAAEEQMELARSLNYESLVLDDADPLDHVDDTDDPDYWIDEEDQTYDPDGAGSLEPEPIVRVAGASPALHHFQSPVVQGNTTYTVYMYVTWVDSATDGLDGSDNADGNGDGVSDANGQDQKRLTVVVLWEAALDGHTDTVSMTSLFSDGKIPYHETSAVPNVPPEVSCPTATTVGKTADLTAVASDTDGTIVRVDWDFGDGDTVTDGGTTQSHTYAAAGTYTVVNTVYDDDGDSATNSGLNCAVTVEGGAGSGPSGTIVIAGGASATTNTQVTLTLSSTGATQMQFSNDGTTWAAAVAYTTSTLYTLPSGDGAKTVYVRFLDSGGDYGATASDSITLDATPCDAPQNLTYTSSTAGANKTVVLSWQAPTVSCSDFAGYRVWKRLTTSTTWQQVSCSGSGTTCSDTFRKQDNYEYYVVTIDTAGNESAQSNHITA